LSGVDEAEERHIISETVRILRSGTGKAPRGWLGSGLAETARTPDILAEHGTVHIVSLCKWGPSTFIRRKRVLPSGRPPEEAITLVQEDPTWELEYAYFKKLCTSGAKTDLSNDIWLGRTLGRLSREAGTPGEA